MSEERNKILSKKLVEFGLSEKEALIYLSLLELEIAGVNEISKRSGINRSSSYVVLESLKKKGFVGISDDKKVRRYIASPPETIHRVAEDLARKQDDVRKSISSIIPELKALHKDTKHRPRVRVLEGKDGLISAFEDSLSCREGVMRVSSSVENLLNIIPEDYFPNYVKRRIEKKIKLKGIHPNTEFAKKIIGLDPEAFDRPLLIPSKDFKMPADFAIYDDKIAYMSPENEGFAIIIESREMSNVMKSIFDLAWVEAERLSKDKDTRKNS